jgi:replicative DNA helicase
MMAMNLALEVEATNSIGIQIFTLEMPVKEYMYRIISNTSGIPIEKIMRGQINQFERDHFNNVAKLLSKRKLFFEDSGGLNVAQIKSIARRKVMSGEVGMIIIDYLQIMGTVAGMKFGTKDLEIGYTTMSLKNLAKELNVPIILLSQLNRAIETRNNPKPILSDLRSSGSIEQDADVVIFMSKALDNYIEFEVAKNRNGRCEAFQLIADYSIQKFYHRDNLPQQSHQFRYPQTDIIPQKRLSDYDDLPF